jgi:hypothetical protein
MLGLKEIGEVAWGVIATLGLMSVVSIAIMAERYWLYRRSARQSRCFVREVSRLLKAGH